MQPLLLVKQTLEVGYDPGPLLLHGPNVRFGRVAEMLWRGKAKSDVAEQVLSGASDVDGELLSWSSKRSAGGGLSRSRVLAAAYWPQRARRLLASALDAARTVT